MRQYGNFFSSNPDETNPNRLCDRWLGFGRLKVVVEIWSTIFALRKEKGKLYWLFRHGKF